VAGRVAPRRSQVRLPHVVERIRDAMMINDDPERHAS
jgi:hypothetical protein